MDRQEYGREQKIKAKNGSGEATPYRKKRDGKPHKKGEGNKAYRNRMKIINEMLNS